LIVVLGVVFGVLGVVFWFFWLLQGEMGNSCGRY